MSKKSITAVVSDVVAALEPLSSEDRLRVVQASMTLLGEGTPTKLVSPNQSVADEGSGLPARAQSWMKQHSLTMEQLEQVFHRSDDGFELIAEVPGKNNRERVRNAYVLFGMGKFLATGLGNFDDKDARALCEKFGIYDHTNHAKYMKGSEFTGTKDKGWILTAPGLKYGASLIAQLAQ